ncbi:MAG TPA: radical SAM/SPASM domain-containing protein [Thermoanaerobaculia bacterium]|jgi:MoaA/NifB/PqqE/SkfB family radical SAM enzyme|nr:radical SAM/SPASM domain-containing protein [Thermoanaerobaculia bacterium]
MPSFQRNFRTPLFWSKVRRVLTRKADALVGRLRPLGPTLEAMAARPYELHFELTNLCNANCVFCPYQYQERDVAYMTDEVFDKAVDDFVRAGGGSVGLTPIVGDALIHPKFVALVRRLRARPEIDRIWVTTNAILLDKHGIEEILSSGLTSITISTSGFDEPSYRRIYRSTAYARFRKNVQNLVAANARRAEPLTIVIGLRTDRKLEEVMRDPDFQPILAHRPEIDFTWSFTSAGGRISREELPEGMSLRTVSSRKETCVQLYNGPIVLPDGTVMACSCVAAMDAVGDLGIGNLRDADLLDLWRGETTRKLRASFGSDSLNPTCAGCDMYRDLELYRTSEGRERASISHARGQGQLIHRAKPTTAFGGG